MHYETMNRRTLLKHSMATSASLLVRSYSVDTNTNPRTQQKPLFKLDLCGRRVGIDANQEQLIELAQKHGFGAVEPLIEELKTLDAAKLDELNAKLDAAKLVWSAADLPVDFRTTPEKFQEDLKNLPIAAKALQSAGVTRIGTWVMPCHELLTYRANFRKHSTRLKETAQVLEQHGLRLGLEYVGTKSVWTKMKYPFIHTMAETKELIAVIGQNNVGFVLDSWHWTMAGENSDSILSLKNKDVVAVDLNDLPAGIELDQQNDRVRELPMATGAIEMKSFLQALVDIKYDGPVRAEPFCESLNKMDNDTAAKVTAEAMKKAIATVGA